jgi:hypothetical protein
MISRKCTFCDVSGHNIQNCQNDAVLTFESEMHSLRNHILTFSRIDTTEFNIWLSSQDVKLVSSFAIRKCGGLQRDGTQELIAKISYHFADEASCPLIQIQLSERSKIEDECAICYEIITKQVAYNCNHVFCADCVVKSFRNIKKTSCAMCRSDITSISVQDKETQDELTLLLKQ